MAAQKRPASAGRFYALPETKFPVLWGDGPGLSETSKKRIVKGFF